MSEARRLRVAFLGNDGWSVPSLAAVAASMHEVVRVVTRPPRPGRRGTVAGPTPVADEARRAGLPLAEVETVRSGPGLDALSGAEPDVLAVVAYGEILPPEVLALASVASVNVHFSLLPRLRGASPVQTALLRGLHETGVTTIAMDAGLDTGDVLMQRRTPIDPEDDAGSLGDRLAREGGELLVETIDRLASGEATRTPQDGSLASYAPKLTAEDRRIDWSESATSIVDRVRALSPEPAATSSFRDAPVKIFRARVVEGAGAPGEVVGSDEGLRVASADAAVRIEELAPAGRPRMTARAFVNGYRPRKGERWS